MNELVVSKRALSHFQLALLTGSKSGIVTPEVMERIRNEGADMVQATVNRFFLLAKGGSYDPAVRLVDFFLSFALAIDSQESHEMLLVTRTLSQLISQGVTRLKKISTMPFSFTYGIDDGSDHGELLSRLLSEIGSPDFNPGRKITSLLEEESERAYQRATIKLASYAVRHRWGGQYSRFREEEEYLTRATADCDLIVNSFFFSAIFDIAEGYELTVKRVIDAGKRKRPTLEEARTKLSNFRRSLNEDPRFKEVADIYDKCADQFLNNKFVKSFFARKLGAKSLCVFSDRYSVTLFTKGMVDF